MLRRDWAAQPPRKCDHLWTQFPSRYGRALGYERVYEHFMWSVGGIDGSPVSVEASVKAGN